MRKNIVIGFLLFSLLGCSVVNEDSKKKDETIIENYLEEDSGYLYYYDNLTKKQKKMYKNIYNSFYLHEDKCTINSIDTDEILMIYESVINDHPEIYYVDGYHEFKNEAMENTQIVPTYLYNKKEIKKLNQQLDDKSKSILDSIPANANEIDKTKYIYEYIIGNISYSENIEENQTIISSLLSEESVCAGYARAMQYLLEKEGISITYLTGYSLDPNTDNSIGHAWNMVKINNDYYYIDSTWGGCYRKLSPYLLLLLYDDFTGDVNNVYTG